MWMNLNTGELTEFAEIASDWKMFGDEVQYFDEEMIEVWG